MTTRGKRGHNIRFPDDLWEAAEKKSTRTGCPISGVVNAGLEVWVKEPDRTEDDFKQLEAELYDIDYSHEIWTKEALKRREEIIIILARAGRL